MPSLPRILDSSAHLVANIHTPSSEKYREVAYHLNGRNRYVAQSYEIRSPSQHSHVMSPAQLRSMPHDQSTERASLWQSNASQHPSKPSSGKFVIVVQSRDSVMQEQADNTGAAKSSELTVTPPAPRPRRLATPDLFDIDDDRSFCHCEFEKESKSAPCQ